MMKELLPPNRREVAGVFELDQAGTILYSESEPKNKSAVRNLVGRNLFDEVVAFDNL